MIGLLARRLLLMVPILGIVSFLVFGLVVMVPGDPAITLAGENATPQQIAAIREQLGLDDPLWQQYGRWVSGAVRGDLGSSLFSGRPVTSSITERMGVTVSLAGLSMVVALLIAVPAGIISATRQGRWPDRVATVAASTGLAMPSFFVGLVLVLVVSIRLRWLPPTGYVPIQDSPGRWLRHLLLPAITLGTAAAAETTRQLRSALIDVLQQDYIRTARAKGTRERWVVLRHGLKNAATPVITVLGFQVAFLLGGSVIVEQIFVLPGLGSLAIRAVIDRDIPVIQGVVVFAAVLVMVTNLVVDLLYGWLNPKVRTT